VAWGAKPNDSRILGKPKLEEILRWGKKALVGSLKRSLLVADVLREDLDFDGNDTVFHKTEFLGGADGDVDDASFGVRAAVIDGDNLGFIVGHVDDTNFRAHWQGFVSGGKSVVAETLAAGSSGAVIGPDRIPRGFALLDGFYSMV
jgi:hypothetical protein